MGAPDRLQHLTGLGLRLTRRGDKIIASPREAVTPGVIDLIRTHKPELLAALGSDADTSTAAAEDRRGRVLAMLDRNQSARYAALTDSESDPEAVILALALRGRTTCELRIPRDRYDPILLFDLIERHGATVH